jgi:type 1 fimbria pilin
MKKLALGFVATLMLLTAALAAPKTQTFNGEIMDSSCAMMGSHEGMMKMHQDVKTAKECTLACVKMGAKFVLFDPATKTTYKLDDQQKPVQFAGEKVKVRGTYDAATRTIHVVSIRSGS